MITNTLTLTCKFKDSLGKSKSINIDAPKDDITTEEINAFMQAAIDTNILLVDEDQPEVTLATIESAEIINKTVEKLDLTEFSACFLMCKSFLTKTFPGLL